jgi:hypothetical protein
VKGLAAEAVSRGCVPIFGAAGAGCQPFLYQRLFATPGSCLVVFKSHSIVVTLNSLPSPTAAY